MTVSGSSTLLNVPGTIKVYNTPGSGLTLQSSGAITAGGINLGGVSSLFNWSSGTLTITNDVAWDAGAGAASTGSIFGSSLSLSVGKNLKVIGNETIGGNGAFNLSVGTGIHTVTGNITLKPGGSISQSNNGGTIGYANFTQAGGTISSFFRNTSNFTYQSGSLTAQFVNDGTMTLGSSLTISNSFQNNVLMTVAANQTFTANSGINNFGSFVLAGGTIGQSSAFTNAIGGTLTAHGTINPSITNHGTMVVDGVLSLGISLNNDGIVQGAGTVNLISTFTNSAGGAINATNAGRLLFRSQILSTMQARS